MDDITKINSTNSFEGELLKRATDSGYLARRLEMNKDFQRYDFSQWAIEQIKPTKGDKVLDIGCGRGAQAIPISGILDKTGEITLIDLSQDSVRYVLNCVREKTKSHGINGTMDNIASLLGPECNDYDLAYSVYALYYANNSSIVLNEMYNRLRPGGRLCIIGPDGPHGLVEIARKFHVIPSQVDNSFKFRSEVIEPFFKKNFSNFQISFLKNPQSFTVPNSFIEFYRQTTYYVKQAEKELHEFAADQIKAKGALIYDKYSYAITAIKGTL